MGYDVFLSYAHLDNGAGFIDRLREYIEKSGPAVYGRHISVYYDGEIPAGTRWEPELLDQLWACRVLVPVLSPSWLNREWTQRELREKFAQVGDDFSIGNQTCILPIGFQLDREHKDLLDGAQALQLKSHFSLNSNLDKEGPAFLKDLAKILKRLDEDRLPLANIFGAGRRYRKVFLGMAFSQQMSRWRKALQTHLRMNCVETVEFEWQPNENALRLQARAQATLTDCDAAIHFLDIHGGRRNELGQIPGAIQIQCAAGDARAKNPKPFTQISWKGPSDEWDYEEDFVGGKYYWAFVEAREDRYKTATFNAVKQTILERLQAMDRSGASPPPAAAPQACIIYERDDEKPVKAIQQYLQERGWTVSVPDPSDTLKEFKDPAMKWFLFYWGCGKRLWCSRNFEDLSSARVVGDSPPGDLSAVGLYLGAQWKNYKQKENLPPFRWPYIPMGDPEKWGNNIDEFPYATDLTDFVNAVEAEFRARN